ncbi:MAG: hypothetical protein BAJATHORv1_150011 [Candidatus Thorarchaeota archaeon]|nr:MAG: hypothetical protein BAJATHORv1_150011 [Candidatus Thorarchaeota archaeon]
MGERYDIAILRHAALSHRLRSVGGDVAGHFAGGHIHARRRVQGDGFIGARFAR